MPLYHRPTSLDDALKALGDGPLTIVAGGTDFYPQRVGVPLDDDVLDVTAIDGLRAIAVRNGGVHIGALATWTDIVRADLPPWMTVLVQCAREIGGVQTQNAGTVAGNVCNASPAADGVPCLLALDASVELESAAGTRTVPLAEFVTGVREIQRRPDEMVTGLLLPKPERPATGVFRKLGARKYMIIAIASVAAVIEMSDDGSVAAARIAIGACSPVAQRLPGLEAGLRGRAMSAALGDVVTPEHFAGLSPISDIRASADYRMEAALILTRRVVSELGSGGQG
ncbi:MAG: FAD binding domain-containing protein [Alphaproteobacteria bacterium]